MTSTKKASFFIGIFFAGLTAESTTWGWYFWIGCILAAITGVTAYLTIPSDIQEKRTSSNKVRIGLAWCSPYRHWVSSSSHSPSSIHPTHPINGRPRIPTYCSSSDRSCLLASAYVETRVVSQPLLPAFLFCAFCMLVSYYCTLFHLWLPRHLPPLRNILHGKISWVLHPFRVVAWYVPMALGGVPNIHIRGGLVLHLLPGTNPHNHHSPADWSVGVWGL